MIPGGDLKRGMTLRLDGNLYRVTNTAYNKPGRGTASMRTTLLDIRTGQTTTRIFSAEDRVDNVYVESEPVEFLYDDGDLLHFMNTNTYEQYETSKALFGDDALYLKENMPLDLKVYEGVPIDYVLPTTVIYKIVDSEMAIAGDTAGSVTKSATIESGREIQVPLFVKVGDSVKVDTRDGSYVGRA